jgi:hypothetical protein
MKKILTGLSDNIARNKQKIKVWSESFRKYSDGEIVLIVANATREDIETCEQLKINYYQVEIQDTFFINNKRLKHTRDFMEQSDGDLFLVTDVFDVVFQSDPFQKMDLENYDIFTSGEGILVNQEPWNGDVINKVFPNDIGICLNTEIICSGIIAGKKQAMLNLYSKMDDMCENSPNGHNIKDQAALIIMVAKNQIEKLKIFNLHDGWAMHCQSAGPTVFFERWGLRNSLILNGYKVPKLIGGVVYTEDDKIYDMAHQFNRIEEWNKILIKDYE